MAQTTEQSWRNAVTTLIQRRHHSARHIQKVMSRKGAFWMNSIELDKDDVDLFLRQELGD